MFKFKRLVSIFVFSVLAFGNSALGIHQYAKVVILGSYGAGKTTLRNIIRKNFVETAHTINLSYESVKVYYDNKGNFTFDQNEAYNNNDYKHTVVLNICDTIADEPYVNAVDKFVERGTHIALILADARRFFDDQINQFQGYKPFKTQIDKLENLPDCRIILILTHLNDIPEKYRTHIKKMSEELLKGFKDDVYKDRKIDEVKTLTILQNDSEELKVKYAKEILDCLARSVLKYGIQNLSDDIKDVLWNIKVEDEYENESHCIGKDTKVFKQKTYSLSRDTAI